MNSFFFFFSIYLFYLTFYFIFVYFSNFGGSKNRGSMDPVHQKWSMDPVHILMDWSMDPVHGGGPWTRGPCFVLSLNYLRHFTEHSNFSAN